MPALMAWSLCWFLYSLLSFKTELPLWLVLSLVSLTGVLLSLLGGTWWRRLAIGLGFPLSLFFSGAVSVPAWVWLLPLALLVLIYPLNAWRDAPLFPTPEDALNDLPEIAPLEPGAKVLDAGCGLGHGLEALRQAYPLAELHGVEWSRPLARLCRWRSQRHGIRAQVEQGDMWAADWSAYDLVYLFQRPETLPRAMAKAEAEMRPDTWLVSLEFEARGYKPTARLKTAEGKPVWIYRWPAVKVDGSVPDGAVYKPRR
jgi:SAM-dependent methyltransferase